MSNQRKDTPVRKPQRVVHSGSISSPATAEEIFPLLCPVSEIDWAPGWQPDWVISESGLVEQGCVFQTPADDSHNTNTAIWVVSRHDPEAFEVEMIKVIPGHTVSKLQISLEEKAGNGTKVNISYAYTALGSEGSDFVDACDTDWYGKLLAHWKAAMNHYLATGNIISMVA
jgi:hypothetical protein